MAKFTFSTLPEWLEDNETGASTEPGQLKQIQGESTAYRNEIRIVLMGKTGNGKSKTGNTILGIDSPNSPEDPGFKEVLGQGSGTMYCQMQYVVINGRPIRIVDTPGVCDTYRDHDEVMFEISKCLLLTLPGPHVILFVVNCALRFTAEEYQAFYSMVEHFKSDISKYIIVVFTHGDEMPCGKISLEENLKSNKEMVQIAKAAGRKVPDIDEILEKVGRKYVLFNNKGDKKTKSQQVYELLEMIDDTVNTNSPKYFSDEVTQNITQTTENYLTTMMKDRQISSQTKAWKIFVQEAEAAKSEEERKRQQKEQREREEMEKEQRKKEKEEREREKMEKERRKKEKREKKEREREEMEKEQRKKEKMEKEEREREEAEKEQRKKEKRERETREREQTERRLRELTLMERNIHERENLIREAEQTLNYRREKEQTERELRERERSERELKNKELQRQRIEREKKERENTNRAVGGGLAGMTTGALIGGVASVLTGGAAVPLVLASSAVGGAVGAKSQCSIL